MAWTTWKGRQIPAAAFASAGVILLVPLLLWAVTEEPPELAQNRLRLEQMPALEREQLAVRYAAFTALTPEEQEEYRRMHDELEDNPRLRSILLRYQEWLETLSPWQRDELASTTDASTRRRLVEQFLAEQEQESSSRTLHSGRVRGGLTISESDFQILVAGMLNSLELNEQEREELENRPLMQRASAVLLRVLQRPRSGGNAWPDTDEIKVLQQKLTSQPLQRALRAMPNPQRIRPLLLRSVAGYLEAWWREQTAETRPAPDQLASTFAALTEDEQDQLMRLSPEAQLARLEREYFNQHPELRPEVGELRRVIQQLFQQNEAGGRGAGPAGAAAGGPGRFDQRTDSGPRPFSGRGPRGPGREKSEQEGRPGRLKPGRRNPAALSGKAPRD